MEECVIPKDMEFIDHIHTGSVTYADRSIDVDTDMSRTIKISNEGNQIVRVFLGDISNGKVVQVSCKGDSAVVTYAIEGTLFISANGDIEEVVPIVSNASVIGHAIDEGHLVLYGPSARWTSLVTIV